MMWGLLRPDAVAVLRDGKARQSLRRYFSVMEGESPARFLICRRIPVEVDLSIPEEELWRAHEKGMKELWELLKGVDSGKVKLEEIGKPKVSLLDVKVELAKRMLESCRFCERGCRVNRRKEERGSCGVGLSSRIASEFMHHGEEPELVPSYTIFFNGCTFKCVFCQNWDISQYPEEGAEATPSTLAKLVDSARAGGARNVNWVGGEPTPNLHTILETLSRVKTSIPSVWNSNMYMSVEAMKLLSGTQDVYLTDFKYGNDGCGLRLSKVQNYFEIVARNHKLAFADSEVIIRHLVLPNHLECCTRPVLRWIAEKLGRMVRVNLMDQYRPCYRALEHEEIARGLRGDEFRRAVEIAKEGGLENFIT